MNAALQGHAEGAGTAGLPQWLYDCNTGGPSSRSRSEVVRATVLGDDKGPIRCPRVLRVSVSYGGRSPLAWVSQWMSACGWTDERDAQAHIPLPATPCICQPDRIPVPVDAATLGGTEGLYLALILGLCTSTYYDPRRPVLWTRTSLSRALVLYDGGGFYA